MSRFSRALPAFAGAVPGVLHARGLLGIAPFGANAAATAGGRLQGPALMWGRAVIFSGFLRDARNSRLRRLLGRAALPLLGFTATWIALVLLFAAPIVAQGFPSIKPTIIERAESPEDVTSTLELLLLLTVLSLAPTILIMTTAFTRIVIVFGFLRMALSTQQLPPSQVLTGLALILTFLVMRPTIMRIKDQAIVPYLDAQITQAEAFSISHNHLRDFMFSQVARDDLNTFGQLGGEDPGAWKTQDDVDTLTLTPAFVTTELKRGFYMGFVLYIPFLVIDLVVATVLISMGMLVLPPVLISLPFKVLLFVLVDGWTLIVVSLVKSFEGGPVAT